MDLNSVAADDGAEAIDQLLGYVAAGKAQAAQTRGSRAVIFVGNTGSGKSTLVNYLNGCQFECVTREEAGLQGRPEEEAYRIKADSVVREIMPIGHSNASKTTMPDVTRSDTGGLTFVDCPGFLDNRGFVINVANAINIRQVVPLSLPYTRHPPNQLLGRDV
jgi:energy-coupling factor transporter ATP-binding protein EcfA2